MVWNKKLGHGAWLIGLALIMVACKVSLGLAPISSIDYSKVHTMQIVDFQNHADYVYGPLATTLNDQMKDLFMRQTRLSLVNNNGDIVIEGEITGYKVAIDWEREIIAVYENEEYPYQVGNAYGTTGFFKAESLKLKN